MTVLTGDGGGSGAGRIRAEELEVCVRALTEGRSGAMTRKPASIKRAMWIDHRPP